MPSRRIATLAILLLALGGCAGLPDLNEETRTADAFSSVRTDPLQLRAFLKEFPKGAELHSHLSGTTWAESYVVWAAKDGYCVDVATLALTAPPCDGANRPPVATASKLSAVYSRLIKSLSAVDYTSDGSNAHDQFFGAFGRFNSVARRHTADQLAEVMNRAAGQNVLHVELMATFNGDWPAQTAGGSWTDDWEAMRNALQAKGLAAAVDTARKAVDGVESQARRTLGCGTTAAAAGCDTSVRWIQQVNRGAATPVVFAQMVLAFELATADPRVVALNLVGPEDGRQAIDNYDLHMRMLAYLHRHYPSALIALHAGELVLGLVPPEDLKDHIRKAVEVAEARRIGHGVDIMFEDDPRGLLAEMAERRVLVEVNLTSNDLILSVRGDRHPLRTYMRAGVPVALSTDDEGVERTDLTREYQRAVEEHRLDYADLKRISRDSLEYSFLPGASLWEDGKGGTPVSSCRPMTAASCRQWLERSPKARMQDKLEQRFREFEARRWTFD
jgi:hypothetical protein